MARTTLAMPSSRRWTLPAKALIALATLIGIVGCTHDPDLVTIDLSEIPPPVEFRDDYQGPRVTGRSAAGSIDGRAERNLVNRVSLDNIEEARQAWAAARETAMERVIRDLTEANLARARTEHQLAWELVEEEITAVWAGAQTQLTALVAEYAEQEGPLRTTIAMYAGVPERSRARVQRGLRDDPFEQYTLEKLDATKIELSALEAEFRRRADIVLEEAYAQEAAILQRDQADLQAKLAAARATALADARRIVSEAISTDLRVTGGSELRADPVESKEVEFRSASTRPPAIELESKKGAGSTLAAEAALFARENGWKLSASKQGARDVTQEFIEWRTKLGLGQ